MPKFFRELPDEAVNMTLLLLSVFTFTTAAWVHASKYGRRAESLYQSARALDWLCIRLDSLNAGTEEVAIAELEIEYDRANRLANHDDIDYETFKSKHEEFRESAAGRFELLRMRLMSATSLYVAIILASLVGSAVLSYAAFNRSADGCTHMSEDTRNMSAEH